MSKEVVSALERFFANAAHPVLFAGAGVSVQAGLPIWSSLLRKMVEPVRLTDPAFHNLVSDAIAQNQLTAAAGYIQAYHRMTANDRAASIRASLKGGLAKELVPLIRLPFRSCLTTNFDRVLYDAYAIAHQAAAVEYRYGDSGLPNAVWSEDFHITRIHGGMEVYESIVLSENDFRRLLDDPHYWDLLSVNFTQRNVLFIGFSFYDPAIRHIMTELERRFGASSPGRHMALVPDDINSEFLAKASALNIEVIAYSPSGYHADLWSSIAEFQPAKKSIKASNAPLELTKKYLAACFTRLKAKSSNSALKDALGEGIVSYLLQDSYPKPLAIGKIRERLTDALGIKQGAAEIVDLALNSLVADDLCKRVPIEGGRGKGYVWSTPAKSNDTLATAIGRLSESVVDRAMVTEAWTIPDSIQEKLPELFEHIVRSRGWDLGAAFAEKIPPEPISISTLIEEFDICPNALDRERLERVLTIMFQRPAADESKLLMELGMVSFGLEMAFNLPNTTLLQSATLPRTIYFDASVILPACVYGHPLHVTYNDTIRRLKSAAHEGAYSISLKICKGYLNEIISHKRQASDFYDRLGEDARGAAMNAAMFHGPANSNVYIAGFAHHLESHPDCTLDQYFDEFANYKTESDLFRWLSAKGFEICDPPRRDTLWNDISLYLQKAYSSDLARGKTAILIEHDVHQIRILEDDVERGHRSVFVSADKQLIRHVRSRSPALADHMMSSASIVQFIILMLGGIPASAGITELLWSSRLSDRTTQIRSHLTASALRQYNSMLTRSMPEVMDEAADAITQEMNRRALDLDAQDPAKKAEAFRVFGNLSEEYYFKKMRQEIEKLDRSLDER